MKVWRTLSCETLNSTTPDGLSCCGTRTSMKLAICMSWNSNQWKSSDPSYIQLKNVDKGIKEPLLPLHSRCENVSENRPGRRVRGRWNTATLYIVREKQSHRPRWWQIQRVCWRWRAFSSSPSLPTIPLVPALRRHLYRTPADRDDVNRPQLRARKFSVRVSEGVWRDKWSLVPYFAANARKNSPWNWQPDSNSTVCTETR